MGRAPSHKKIRYRAEKAESPVTCSRQFPDCPAEPNDGDCRICPLYKR